MDLSAELIKDLGMGFMFPCQEEGKERGEEKVMVISRPNLAQSMQARRCLWRSEGQSRWEAMMAMMTSNPYNSISRGKRTAP